MKVLVIDIGGTESKSLSPASHGMPIDHHGERREAAGRQPARRRLDERIGLLVAIGGSESERRGT
jgi:hypothetical protein